MDTVELYSTLRQAIEGSAGGRTLTLSAAYLASLSARGLSVSAVTSTVCCYFLEGTVEVTELDLVSSPPQTIFVEWKGRSRTAPFEGMRLGLKLWTQPSQAGASELRLIISAYGAAPDSVWVLEQGFPFYKDSLLGSLRLSAINDPKYPLFLLSSHSSQDPRVPSGLYCKGMLEVNSVSGITPKLFVGDEAKDKYILIFGGIAAFPPAGESGHRDVRPFVSLYGGLPESNPQRKLGALFPIVGVRYSLKGSPDYNTATRKWEASCSAVWMADLELPVASAPRIPMGVEITRKDGSLRFWSNLPEGVSLAWDALARCIPGVTLGIPDCGFQLQDEVKLTQLEMMAVRTTPRELQLDSISLRVETTADKNRWVLIDGLLTLDAIQFYVLVKDPLGTPRIVFSLSGLVGIGPTGTLLLTADFTQGGNQTDYTFSGRLLEDAPLNIREVLTHVLGHSAYPSIPALVVDDFSFSLQPRTKRYGGQIALSGEWQLFDNLSLQSVAFGMTHDESEGDTSFEASAVFDLGDAQIYVFADYVSGGQGWTFEGGTYDDTEIPIGDWIDQVRHSLGWNTDIPLPAPIRDLVLLNLGIRINTALQEYSFQGTARFPIDGKPADNAVSDQGLAQLTVQMDLEQSRASFRGYLTLFDRQFAVAFASTGLLLATYDGSQAEPVDLKKFLTRISANIGNKVADGISIDLKHAQLAFDKSGDTAKCLFGIELGAGIQLSNLPVVGFLFSRDQTLTVVFHLLAVGARFEAAEIQSINRLTGPDITKIPEEAMGGPEPEFKLHAAVNFGGFSQGVSLALATNVGKADEPQGSKPAITPAGGSGIFSWVKIEKALGPFHFQRIGIGTDGESIAFLIDASLKTAGLTITLDGLGAQCTFADLSRGAFSPTFQLAGLGVDFKKGDLEIGGALIKRPGTEAFDGAVVIHYKRLGIAAMGSYETIAGQPSLFIYALIDYPLGGPAFFFVEGGAIGFGYNRTLTIPGIDAVSEFPLVRQAMSPPQSRLGPMEIAQQLSPHIKPAVGQYFLAAGIRFSSYKTIKGFVLLTVLFGDYFEVDVLGKATLTAPPGPPEAGTSPLMSASLLLLGRYLPDDGLVMVRAQLAPDAHLFAPACHLTGGFALYCWFDKQHKGDFVLTLGGYHKAFQVPDHYPKVPRLALNWQVNPNLSFKADAYFALTPAAIMAGAHLEANWQSGNLQVWFRAEFDFLIGWQPYYYDGHAFVSIGARYRFEFFGKREISAELTAELDVWGPPFSGRAHVQWHIISFDIAFGPERQAPQPLVWADFRKSFLPVAANLQKPEEGRMYKVSAEGGKLAQGNPNQAGDLGVINPRDFCIVLRSPLPVKRAAGTLLMAAVDATPNAPAPPDLGIAPMDKKTNQWDSTLEIKILQRLQGNDNDKSSQFRATRLRDSVPTSLWDQTMSPSARTNKPLIQHAICGYEIKPLDPVKATGSLTITSRDTARHDKTLAPPGGESFIVQGTATPIRTNRLSNLDQTVKTLLPSVEIDWSSVTVEAWRRPPHVVKITTEPILQ